MEIKDNEAIEPKKAADENEQGASVKLDLEDIDALAGGGTKDEPIELPEI